jgi:hypothetical protein
LTVFWIDSASVGAEFSFVAIGVLVPVTGNVVSFVCGDYLHKLFVDVKSDAFDQIAENK